MLQGQYFCVFSAQPRESSSVDTLSICGDELTMDRVPIGGLLFLEPYLSHPLPLPCFICDEGELALRDPLSSPPEASFGAQVRKDLSSQPSC